MDLIKGFKVVCKYKMPHRKHAVMSQNQFSNEGVVSVLSVPGGYDGLTVCLRVWVVICNVVDLVYIT